MNEKLEQTKNEYLTKLKKVELVKAGIDIDIVDDYLMFIDAENKEKIKEQAEIVAGDALGEPVSIEKGDKKVWTLF